MKRGCLAVVTQSCTIVRNSSTVIPLSANTAEILSRSWFRSLAMAAWSPDMMVLNGSMYLSFGYFSSAIATRSKTNIICE